MPLNYLDAGKGPAVVLLHDTGLGPDCWQAQIKPLTRAGLRVIVPDFAGLQQQFSLADYSDAVIALLNRLGIGRAVVCGLGLGGTILFDLLSRFTPRIVGAGFVATRPVADDIAEAARRAELLAALQQQQDQEVRQCLIATLLEGRESALSDGLNREIRQMVDRCSSAALQSGLQAMAKRRDYTDILSQLRLPSLVIGGDFDPICHPGHTRLMASQLPDCRQAVNLPTGHLIPMEQAKAFNALLLDFVQQLVPQRYFAAEPQEAA